MSHFVHIVAGWNQLLWVQVLAYVALAACVVMGAIAVALSRRRQRPLPRRQRVVAWLLGAYIFLGGLLLCIPPRDYVFLVLLGLMGVLLLYIFIQRLSGRPNSVES